MTYQPVDLIHLMACILKAARLATALILGISAPALALAAGPAQEQVTKEFKKDYTINAGQAVKIEHKYGEIRMHGESSRDVKYPRRFTRRRAPATKPKRLPPKFKSKHSKQLKACRFARSIRRKLAVGLISTKILRTLLTMTSRFPTMRWFM